MRVFSKSKIIVAGIVVLLIAARVFYGCIVKNKFVSAIEQSRYVVFRSNNSEWRTNVTESVRRKIRDAVDDSMVIKFFGEKSVSYGAMFLFDGNMSPVARIGVLRYPLFTFDGTQIKLHCDIAGAFGFSIKGYQCTDKPAPSGKLNAH